MEGMEDEKGLPEGADWEWGESKIVPTQLVVRYADGQTHAYPDRNWRVERVGEATCLIIGNGIPCTFVPLNGVLSFDLVEVDES